MRLAFEFNKTFNQTNNVKIVNAIVVQMWFISLQIVNIKLMSNNLKFFFYKWIVNICFWNDLNCHNYNMRKWSLETSRFWILDFVKSFFFRDKFIQLVESFVICKTRERDKRDKRNDKNVFWWCVVSSTTLFQVEIVCFMIVVVFSLQMNRHKFNRFDVLSCLL